VLSMMWALTIPVALLEARGLRASLARSSELTWGHRWRVFLIYVLIIVLVYIVSLLVQGPLMVALTILSGPLRPGRLPVVARVAIPVAGFVTQSVLSPIMTIALSLVYYDERVRKEAFDLEHMMQQMDRTAATPSPAA
jgi:hypothetical protein